MPDEEQYLSFDDESSDPEKKVERTTCEVCGGVGTMNDKPCWECGGSGIVPQK